MKKTLNFETVTITEAVSTLVKASLHETFGDAENDPEFLVELNEFVFGVVNKMPEELLIDAMVNGISLMIVTNFAEIITGQKVTEVISQVYSDDH